MFSCDILVFLVEIFLWFCLNYGLLQIFNWLCWCIVKGGVCSYVYMIVCGLVDVCVGMLVCGIYCVVDYVDVWIDFGSECYDVVVFVMYVFQMLCLFDDFMDDECVVLGVFCYQFNIVFLYCDICLFLCWWCVWLVWNYFDVLWVGIMGVVLCVSYLLNQL